MIRSLVGGACAALLLIGSAQDASAALIVTMNEVGSDVHVSGSGTLNLADLTLTNSGAIALSFIVPEGGTVAVGNGVGGLDVYDAISGPATFGPGLGMVADSGLGHNFGLNGDAGVIGVPGGYVFGTLLAGSAVYVGETFLSIGVIPGTYVWSWGSGANADSFTLQIGAAAVPEPAVALLGTLGFVAVAVRRRRTR